MLSASQKVRIVCVSDTHNHGPGEGWTLPKGDVLVHAGDLTNQGSYQELKKAADWVEKAGFAVKMVIAGNHDVSLDKGYTLKADNSWTVAGEDFEKCHGLFESSPDYYYLHHTSVVVHIPNKDVSLRVFGSPYSPDRSREDWGFQYTNEQADALWNDIPTETDVVITHTPPAGHCDKSQHWHEGGCSSLMKALWRVKPVLHICGHCHEGRGVQIIRWADLAGEVESVQEWNDPSIGTKKQSLLDLTGLRGDRPIEAGKETAVINSSVMANSWGRGSKAFNKPIVVDVRF